MKGTSFLKSLEFSIETVGEIWSQGSLFKGNLKIKGTSDVSSFKVALGYADIKKVHAKTPKCFKVSQQIVVTSSDFNFEFKLDPNTIVSDKRATFFLLYGDLENPFHLQIPILPQALFTEIIKLLDTFFRFKVKDYKGISKGIEYKLIPPTSREYSSVESLALSFEVNAEQNLNLDFDFSLKKLDMSGIKTKMTKENKIINRSLGAKEYMMGKTHLDQDKLLKFFESVFSEVKHKEMF